MIWSTADGKLGGILIEMRSESAGPVHIVVGLGLNMALGHAVRERIDASGNQPVDLCSLVQAGAVPGRNALVAALAASWASRPCRSSRTAASSLSATSSAAPMHCATGPWTSRAAPIAGGIARGVDADGALRVEYGGSIHRIIGGDISVRAGSS